MDSHKRMYADQQVDIDLQLQLLSIMVKPLEFYSENIFLKIVRNNQVLHESKKYKVEPNTNSTQKTKISFQEVELMHTNNKYYASKRGSKDKWEAIDITIYVMSESSVNIYDIG